jgi:hypothetical protein
MRISKVVAIAALVSSGALASVFCTSSKPAAAAPAPTAASAAAPPEGYVRKVTPEDLAGSWYVEMKFGTRSVEGSLHFSIVSGVLAGSFTRGDGAEQELKNIKISGDEVSWDAEGSGASQHAKGKIDGSSMKGTMKRVAVRRGSDGRGASGSGDSPEGEGDSPPPSGGGYAGGGGRRGGGGGRRGGGGRGGSSSEITFTAYKSGAAPAGTPPAAPPSPSPAAR